MKHSALQNLVGRAIVDQNFRARLLNGSREQALAECKLSEAECNVVRGINAQSFEEFAEKLDEWIEHVDSRQNLDMPQLTQTC